MKITKYEHACLVLEEQGKKLVIDPGDFSSSLPDLDNVVAIVVTHVHFDHLNQERVDKLLTANPKAQIFSVNQVKEKLATTEICTPNSGCKATPFELQFFGETHAIIHPDYPKFENTGVLVNDAFYYAGDSLIKPGVPIKVLAVPASGPWAKTGEVMDYLAEIKPEIVIPVHDSLNSDAGNASQDRWFSQHAEKHGIKYQRLAVRESLEIRSNLQPL